MAETYLNRGRAMSVRPRPGNVKLRRAQTCEKCDSVPSERESVHRAESRPTTRLTPAWRMRQREVRPRPNRVRFAERPADRWDENCNFVSGFFELKVLRQFCVLASSRAVAVPRYRRYRECRTSIHDLSSGGRRRQDGGHCGRWSPTSYFLDQRIVTSSGGVGVTLQRERASAHT